MRKLFREIYRYLFGCRHERCGWPMRDPGGRSNYQVCLDCGTEMPYTRIDFTAADSVLKRHIAA